MNVESFAILLSDKTGYSIGDILNMSLIELRKLVNKHYDKKLKIKLIDKEE